MKHSLYTILLFIVLSLASCGKDKSGQAANDTATIQNTTAPFDTFAVKDTVPQQVITHPDAPFDKDSAFIVISKKDLTLTVYAPSQGDTLAIESFPVCMGKNLGDKQGKGDMRTPESPNGKPFTITMIQDASTWKHDFGDGRGSILAYGHWFLRLDTPGHSGIGIHGSTNNEHTVPGRASEGCIRLLDKDIITLKERYARVGMLVIVKAEEQGLLSFEQRCLGQQADK